MNNENKKIERGEDIINSSNEGNNDNKTSGSISRGKRTSDKILHQEIKDSGSHNSETTLDSTVEPYEIDPSLQEEFAKELLKRNADREHISSNWLSPSRLGWPVQWQVLYALGVPQKPLDEYTLRKFYRGHEVEDKVAEMCKLEGRQTPIEYRGIKGFADAVKNGIPYEIKSVTNMKFKHIQKQGADRSHKLQATCYALALGVPQYAICYVASDDYRILTLVYQTSKSEEMVNKIIFEFQEWMAEKAIPPFNAIEAWQASSDYNMYPDWSELSPDQLASRAKELFANHKRQ